MAKKLKKVDIRLDEDTYNELNFIVKEIGAKRSSLIRSFIEAGIRAKKIELLLQEDEDAKRKNSNEN